MVTDRRGERVKLFRDRALRRLDVRAGSAEELHSSPRAAEYLALANIRPTAIGVGREIVARIALFSHASIVYYSGPEIEVRWTRDAQSADRVLLVVGITAGVEVTGDPSCVVVTRDPRLTLVAPGSGEVKIALRAPGELLYLTVPSGILADLPLPPVSAHVAVPAEPSVLSPMVAFLAQLCRTSGGEADDVAQLPTAANEIVRALALMITRNATRRVPLHERAMEVISRDFAERGLSARRIADQLDVAPRTLQLAFQREGQTLAAELRRTRAHAAEQARAVRPDMSMSSIAASVGFGSESAMFRALRELRDATPGDGVDIAARQGSTAG